MSLFPSDVIESNQACETIVVHACDVLCEYS